MKRRQTLDLTTHKYRTLGTASEVSVKLSKKSMKKCVFLVGARSAKILNFENLIPRELFTFQGPPLLKSDTGLFMDLKITLVSSQTSRILHEAVSLQPPAFLKFFKKIKS